MTQGQEIWKNILPGHLGQSGIDRTKRVNMEYGMLIFPCACIPKRLYTVPMISAGRQIHNQTFGRVQGLIKVIGNAAVRSSILAPRQA
jgi:hypothetical protein